LVIIDIGCVVQENTRPFWFCVERHEINFKS